MEKERKADGFFSVGNSEELNKAVKLKQCVSDSEMKNEMRKTGQTLRKIKEKFEFLAKCQLFLPPASLHFISNFIRKHCAQNLLLMKRVCVCRFYRTRCC